MALIDCHECGKKISDEASTCPGCGCPTKYAQEEKIYGCISGCLLLLGFSIFSWWGFNTIFFPDEDPWYFLKESEQIESNA